MLKHLLLLVLSFSLVSAYSQDTDGDFIPDSIDVDDDNDGIYDINENKENCAFVNRWFNNKNVRVNKENLFFTGGNSKWKNGVSSSLFSEFGFTKEYKVSFFVGSARKVVVGFGEEDTSKDFEDVDYGFFFERSRFNIVINGEFKLKSPKFYNQLSLVNQFKIVYTEDKLKFYHRDELVYETTVGYQKNFLLDTAFFGNTFFNSGNVRNISICSLTTNLDIDGDGLINSVDLDSDGDGCYDVIEAGFADGDNDGVLGTGRPFVRASGAVRLLSAYGYGCLWGDLECAGLNYDFLSPKANICFYGIVINTSQLPKTTFEVLFKDTKISDQTSGEIDSELRVQTIENTDNDIFISIPESEGQSALEIKVFQSRSGNLEIFVKYQNQWKPLAKEFYTIENNTIYFKNTNQNLTAPFRMNLKDGVYYDKASPLTLELQGSLRDLNSSKLEILGPDNFKADVAIERNTFTWDGSQASSGNYSFILKIQDQQFTGQFIISN